MGSRLKHLLDELAAEVERLQGRASGSDKAHDLSVLTDEELARLETLLRRRAGAPVFGPPVTYPTPTNRRYYEAQPDREPPREWMTKHEPEPLTDEEEAELRRLLARAREGKGEPWEGSP